jgi:hypothetical protein
MHQKNNLSERWKYFSWFGLCAVNKSTNKVKSASDMKSITITLAINHLEAIAISIAEPRLNLQGGKFGKKCQQYLQVPVKREDENTN